MGSRITPASACPGPLHRREFLPYVWLTPVMGLLFFLLGCLAFNRGVRAYESTGS